MLINDRCKLRVLLIEQYARLDETVYILGISDFLC